MIFTYSSGCEAGRTRSASCSQVSTKRGVFRQESESNEAVEPDTFVDQTHPEPAELFGNAVVGHGLADESTRIRH